MSTEREKKRERLWNLLADARRKFFTEWEATDHLLANGIDVTLPPEPEWKPGQVVRLRLEDGMPYLAKRVDSNDGWEVFGVDVVITDHEVTDVEPVAVLNHASAATFTAAVVKRLASDPNAQPDGLWLQMTGEAVEDEFRERGLDL